MGKTEAPSAAPTSGQGDDTLDALIRTAHGHPTPRGRRVGLMVLGEGEVHHVGGVKTYKQRDGSDVPARFFALELRVREGTRHVIYPVKCSVWGAHLVKLTEGMRRGSRVQVLGDLNVAPDADLVRVPSIRVADLWVVDE